VARAKVTRIRIGLSTLAVALLFTGLASGETPLAPKDLLERSLAAYAALGAYSDTGTVTTEYRSPGAPALIETHTFATCYRAPRRFLFDFMKKGGERFVIWCDGGDFQTWWSATRVHDTYEKGRGTLAFALAATPTKGSALQIAPLLFTQAGLKGPILNFEGLRSDGTETVGSHRCYKLRGEVSLAYATGAVTGKRAATIWIDAETLLVRKMFEDTPAGTGGGVESRVTTTFEPRGNPDLDDGHFQFAAPR
jgi:hypothetical protein